MLLHILIATDELELQGKLRKLLTKTDTVVEIVKNPKKFWKKIPHRTADLLIVGRDLVTSFEEISNLTDLPDAPSVVILSPEENGTPSPGC